MIGNFPLLLTGGNRRFSPRLQKGLFNIIESNMLKLYKKLEILIPAIIFLVIFMIMIVNIASRELLSVSMDWPIELSRYALVWLTFSGTVYLFRTQQHIKVDAFWNYLKKHSNKKIIVILEVIKSIVIIFFACFITYYGYIFSEKLKFFSSPSLNISQYYLYIIVPISGVLIILISLFRIYLFNRRK